MTEVVVGLEPLVYDEEDHPLWVSAVADQAADGRWSVWLEFIDPVTGAASSTDIETHQASRADVTHWAGTLTGVYLRGALARARAEPESAVRIAEGSDLFALEAKGVHVLHRALRPLHRAELLRLIDDHGLNRARLDLTGLDHPQLLTFICTAVQVQAGRRRHKRRTPAA